MLYYLRRAIGRNMPHERRSGGIAQIVDMDKIAYNERSDVIHDLKRYASKNGFSCKQ